MVTVKDVASITALTSIAGAILFSLMVTDSFAAAFRDARYDPQTDELVVTLTYRGTNPDHGFNLRWGECRRAASGASNEIPARILDDQWDDRAREEFTKTVRFSLADLRCRPAAVTLFSAPHFRVTVNVPARGTLPRTLRGPRTDAN